MHLRCADFGCSQSYTQNGINENTSYVHAWTCPSPLHSLAASWSALTFCFFFSVLSRSSMNVCCVYVTRSFFSFTLFFFVVFSISTYYLYAVGVLAAFCYCLAFWSSPNNGPRDCMERGVWDVVLRFGPRAATSVLPTPDSLAGLAGFNADDDRRFPRSHAQPHMLLDLMLFALKNACIWF